MDIRRILDIHSLSLDVGLGIYFIQAGNGYLRFNYDLFNTHLFIFDPSSKFLEYYLDIYYPC